MTKHELIFGEQEDVDCLYDEIESIIKTYEIEKKAYPFLFRFKRVLKQMYGKGGI